MMYEISKSSLGPTGIKGESPGELHCIPLWPGETGIPSQEFSDQYEQVLHDLASTYLSDFIFCSCNHDTAIAYSLLVSFLSLI